MVTAQRADRSQTAKNKYCIDKQPLNDLIVTAQVFKSKETIICRKKAMNVQQ